MTNFETRDEFNRRPIAEKIIQLINSEIEVSPMIIDGIWGSGKTEFTQKLIHLLIESTPNYSAVYLDAFKAEHANNPILSLLAEIVKSLPPEDQETTVKKLAPTLTLLGKTVGKAAVSWVLKQDAADIADDYDQQIKEASDSLIDYSTEKLLSSFVKEEEDLQTLQSILESMTAKKPMVIFIDELDRCRPDYAVSMLESIKHIFDITGLKFVLVTNMKQLKATINHTYGSEVDAQRYLDKFFAFKVTLPTHVKDSHELEDNAVKLFKLLITESSVLKGTVLKELTHGHVWVLCYLIKTYQRSLREVETLIRYLEVYQVLSEGLKERTHFGYSLFRVIGVYLYTFEADMTEDILASDLDGNSLLTFFGIKDIEELDSEEYRNWIADILRMLGRECAQNFEQFMIQDRQEMEDFVQTKRSYFGGGAGNSDNISLIVESAINELRMFKA